MLEVVFCGASVVVDEEEPQGLHVGKKLFGTGERLPDERVLATQNSSNFKHETPSK